MNADPSGVAWPRTKKEKDTVAHKVKDGLAWLSFSRPNKSNCVGPKLNRQMMRVLDALEFRDVGA